MTCFETSGLTWMTAARERAEKAAAKLRALEGHPPGTYAETVLLEAEDELRTAANHCADSVRSLRREAAQS